MRATERSVLLGSTAALLLAAFGAAIATGELAGFYFPGSEVVHAVVFGLCGFVILRSRPGHTVGRLLMWSGLLGALAQLVGQFGDGARSSVLFATWGLMLVALARFPDGDWVSRWSKWLVWGMLVAFAAQAALWALLPIFGDPAWEADPPAWTFAGITAAGVLGAAFVVATIIGMFLLVRGDPVRSRQIGVVILGGVATLVLSSVARLTELEGLQESGVLDLLGTIVFPITVLIAITRYRLYEIDRVISRTVSYTIVVGAMVGVAAAAGAGLTLLLGETSDLVVAIASLAGVSVYLPVARRVRRWVDRRFFRSRYDSAEVIARVADELRTTVDLAEVEERAESVIDEVFAPEAVGVWLAD